MFFQEQHFFSISKQILRNCCLGNALQLHKSQTQPRNFVVDLENAMREAGIEKMKCLSVCFTLDQWTSKADQNCTGFAVHFLGDDQKWCCFAQRQDCL